MAMTMIETILARHAGLAHVSPGDIVVCDIDMTIMLDIWYTNTFPKPKRISNPDKVVLVMDHFAPAANIHDATAQKKARDFAREFGITRVFDIDSGGISHQLALEHGLALPGQTLACGDSHTIASGALNCAARGLGAAEMLEVICTGKTWYKVSPTIRILLEGEKPADISGKDIFLHIAGLYGSVEGHNVEFGGSSLAQLNMNQRSTLSAMLAEMSADFGVFPADEVTFAHLASIGATGFEPAEAGAGARYAQTWTVDLSAIRPYVALPGFIPNNTQLVADLDRHIAIDQAFIGSCANGKLDDFSIAARIVRGKRVHPGVRFIVTPASQQVYLEALAAGYVETLMKAGAVVTNSTCGACFGGHMGVLAAGETCITSSTRNFKGRMGSPDAEIYIGSSATVAASALAGHIVDPTPYLLEAVAL
jgi:3-isopropylmalate/(R)-2-methylmalate dehydratase large subunit